MDTFTLAATSFTIALSLFITGKMDRLQKSFAVLCLTVFISQAAAFLKGLIAAGFWNHLEHLGLLAIPPAVVFFSRMLTRNESFLSKGSATVVSLISVAGAVSQFTPLGTRSGFHLSLIAYICMVLGVCYFSLLYHVNRLSPSTEKRRLSYLLFACSAAAFICLVDLSAYLGYHFAPLSGLVLSALLYFTLLIVAYPQLSELHHFFVRALVIVVSTLTGAAIIYLVSFFFSGSPPSFTSVFMMSFLIIISITPVKMMLKNMFNALYPESKDVFTSLYEFDEKLEKEKALMLAEMAPVFAHEIRNPLGSIKGAAQCLQSEAATEEQGQLLKVIIEEVNRLNTVVSQFLDYARPASSKIRSRDINAIVLRTISIIAANRMTGNVAIFQELQEGLPQVDIDEQQLLQVMINISLNAIEAMPRGGDLTYKTSQIQTGKGPAVDISIQDTGNGIRPENLKDIFKPFYTTKESGVGLGLAICRRIIREHGGSIRVKSIAGQGSIFFIQLGARE
ncbi:MAG: ATP-binding protein [Smithellaceae bacterium]|nr:ATP-binding protein [Smithellaceae bacterium]